MKKLFIAILTFILISCVAFSVSCSFKVMDDTVEVYVTDIVKTDTVGLIDYYTVYYSNGTSSTFQVTNGRNGTNASDITVKDMFEAYKEIYGEISFEEFLKIYLSASSSDNTEVIGECLLSAMKVYTEFKVTETVSKGFLGTEQRKSVSIMCGSAIVYKMEEDFSYIVTNYHVVYSENANEDNGSKIASRIVGYLYGAEGSPYVTQEYVDGYSVYNYGVYGIELEYVGGSPVHDIAVLKVSTDKLLAINDSVKPVTLADDYYVGETAIAIGNPENEGISVTEGIVSVSDEFINLSVDGTVRAYRSIRIDTSIYGGSSGGGLFNVFGELIGITNAGDQTDENINYAIPIEIVRGATDNILYYYKNMNANSVKRLVLGVTLTSKNSKYVFDKEKGFGYIKEDVLIDEVIENSLAYSLGLRKGDFLTSIFIGNNEFKLMRYFDVGDVILQIRPSDQIKLSYTRNGESFTTSFYTVSLQNLVDAS